MKSYKKILLFFKKLNIHRSLISTQTQQISSYNQFLFLRNKKQLFNLNLTLISFYTILKMIQELSINKGPILFVGNDINSQDSFFQFFKIKNTNFFFIKKWFPGILTNQENLSSIFQTKKSLIKKVSKLRFFRYFFNLTKLKKPNLVIIFQSDDALLIIKECYSQDIPVAYLGNNINYIKQFSYKIPANLNSFISFQLFLQLFVSQLNNNNNNEKKIF